MIRRGAALLALALLLALTAAATARADSVRIEAPAEVPAGAEYTVKVAVETTHGDGKLVVLRRSGSGPPCAATHLDDPPLSETAQLTYYPIPVGASGSFEVTDTISDPGDYRLCAWLNQGVIHSYAAAADAFVHVRPLAGSLRIRYFRQSVAGASGAFLEAEVSGSSEGRVTLLAQVGSIHRPCPEDTTPDEGVLHMLPERGTSDEVGPRPFRVHLRSDVPVVHGRYRLCVAIGSSAMNGPGVAARDSATLATELAPVHSLRGGPVVRRRGHRLFCDRGDWVAVPPPRFSVFWQFTLDAKHRYHTIAGAHGWWLRPRRAGDYRCIVTAVNRVGRSRDASGAEYVFNP